MLRFPCLCAIPAAALPLQKTGVALPLCSLLRHTGFLGGSPSAWPPLCLRCAAEKILYAILGFTFVVLFQIVLCLIVGCVGVSIIWCAICGWILREEKFLSSEQITTTTTRPAPNNDTSCGAVTSSPPIVATEQSKLNLLSIVLSMDLSAIIYYSIVEEPITTLAHILAIIMGICISYVGERFFYPTVSSESTIPLIGNRN
uniref:Uncharacterized protein n=1 Tax=Ditylum brightwellii TaxID=49249 RepID=A0A6V2M9M9_9STRA